MSDSIALLDRRKAIVDSNTTAEKTRNSGWHPADAGAEARERNKELSLSERPVILQDNDRIHVVGPCCGKVTDALKAFIATLKSETDAARAAGDDDPDFLNCGLKYQSQAVKFANLAISQGDHINLTTQEWNYVNTILGVQNVQVSHSMAKAGRTLPAYR
jgi:hypothetical protein